VPKLSIVVPTRNRCDTLRHTLRTIFAQKTSSIEIIVSDNFSDDGTGQYVSSLEDPRLKYINTGRRLSMSENWEFALKHCNGDFVTFIGDDDGFTPDGIEIALQHLERSGLPAIIWEKAEYCWPDHVADELRNICVMRIAGFDEQILTSATQLAAVCGFKRCYSRLPCIYNGIISKNVLLGIIDKSVSQRLFVGICPDVLSSLAVAASISKFAFLQYPVSVNGASRHSNGTSCFRSKPTDKDSAHAKFLSELNVKYPSEIKMAPSVNTCIIGELLIARNSFPQLAFPEPDYAAYIRVLVKECQTSNRHDDLIQSASHTAEALGIALPSFRRQENAPSAVVQVGRNRDMVTQRFSSDVVENIYDACMVVGSIASSAANVNDMTVPKRRTGGDLAAKVRRTYEKARRHVIQAFPRSSQRDKNSAAA
jgi:glycosyltransferase involved in cell wall biosynthesis